MAYYNPTLAEILNALAEGSNEQPYARHPHSAPPNRRGPPPHYHQHPFRQPPPPFQRHTPPPPPFGFALYDDEDEDSYYPAYYRQDPYAGFFDQRAQDLARTQALAEAQQRQRQQQSAQAGYGEEQEQPVDFLDYLSQLTGTDLRNPTIQTKDENENEYVEKEEQEKQQENQQGEAPANKGEETAATKPAEPSTTSAPKPTPALAPKQSFPKPNPVLRRHSTFRSAKEPTPKIEISQRNTANPTLPYTPQSNVYSTEGEYVAILAIPGASLKDLDIDFHPSTNEIVIKGTIPDPITSLFPTENDQKAPSLKISEVRTGSIERRIKFPNLPKIDDDQIKAKYINGLLTIRIPKFKEESGSKPKIRKVTIEDVPDEELVYEENAGYKDA